ncbi:MAG: RNase adapter RapZ [Spirochaetaceae bacterium]|nr:RNase adapter RapZ [Myxococcales bacterium]MCB9726156.1 RNase adapter RapZ [Spirochaetaceae bacterium]
MIVEPEAPRIVFVAGLSGSGKTTAMAALEDLSFYCVDNLPVQLVPQFLALCTQASSPIRKIALALDARERNFLAHFPELVAELRGQGASVDVVFLDCNDEVLERRYRETRRVHPLSPEGSVRAGIERERRLLDEVVGLADLTIDTTALNVHQLKDTMVRHVTGGSRRTVVNLLSFGFKHGTPASVELLFDVRFLPNPYFEEGLRAGTGRDPEVADFVLRSERGRAFRDRLASFVEYLLPMYDEEGKAYLTIGVGCTGGRHRSVAIVESMGEGLTRLGRDVSLTHRDIDRPV